MTGAANEPLDPALPADLARADAYPDDPSAAEGVREVQTHLSYVFLTGERVYKLKKSADVGFVSFLTRAARNRNCLRELALNRRLAPDVYLGIAPVARHGRSYVVEAVDPEPRALADCEHCVVMRRLPEGRDAGALLDAGSLPPTWLDCTARRIAAFHADQRLGRPSPFSAEEWLDRIWRPVAANFDSLDASGSSPPGAAELGAPLRELRAAATERFAELKDRFELRRAEGRAVDGHGDLHLEHVWFEGDDGEPRIIDCLEFDDELRRIDAASEVGFLAMDLGFRGHVGLAERWLASYAAAADDFGLYAVVDFFQSYRAAVRAKVEAIAARDPQIPEAQRRTSARRARERVAFATAALARRAPGPVYLVGGLIGAGKSSVARSLAEATRGVVIASDAVRRGDELAQSQGAAGDDFAAGRYADAARERIYDEVMQRAEAVVDSGRPAIVDASFSSAARRRLARSWAAARGSRSRFVEVRCGREETLARLEKRRREGRDPSEAGPEIYDRFAASFDPVRDDEWTLADRWIVRTDHDSWRTALRDRIDQESDDV